MNRELSDVQAGFRKGRGTRDQISNIRWITEKAREFQKNIYLCFIDYARAFDCVDHNKLWKILKEMGIPDHLTCLLRNLYAGQEATVRTGHGLLSVRSAGPGRGAGCGADSWYRAGWLARSVLIPPPFLRPPPPPPPASGIERANPRVKDLEALTAFSQTAFPVGG